MEEKKVEAVIEKKTTAKKATTKKATPIKDEATKQKPTTKTAAKKAVTVKPIAEKDEIKPKKTTSKKDMLSENSVVSRENPKALAYWMAGLLDDKKGENIAIVDINAKTVIADYFVIASVSNTTAVKALVDYVDEKLVKDFSIEPLRRDLDAKWSAVDYGSVILHVFVEETRQLYQLEKLWDDGKNVAYFKRND